jgi:hypothetical protein
MIIDRDLELDAVKRKGRHIAIYRSNPIAARINVVLESVTTWMYVNNLHPKLPNTHSPKQTKRISVVMVAKHTAKSPTARLIMNILTLLFLFRYLLHVNTSIIAVFPINVKTMMITIETTL